MILQGDETVLIDTVINPLLLVFFSIAAVLFLLTSYKKKELRFFTVVLVIMAIAIMFCMVENTSVEGILMVTASTISVLCAIYLRINTNKDVGGVKSGSG